MFSAVSSGAFSSPNKAARPEFLVFKHQSNRLSGVVIVDPRLSVESLQPQKPTGTSSDRRKIGMILCIVDFRDQ
jgi:hypothetical protein